MTTTTVGEPTQTWPSREKYLAELEEQRRKAVRERRQYYSGTQYDEENAECLRDLATGEGAIGEKSLVRLLHEQLNLPEHLRKHAYSTQLRECVDWIADRLAQGFAVEATPDEVGTVIDRCLDASPALSSTDDDEQRSITTVLREAGKTGDVPALIRWDAAEGTCWLEFWPSEQVEMRFVEGRPDKLESVSVEQIDWRPVDGQTQQVTLRREWVLSAADEGNGEGQPNASRCVERVYIVNADEETSRRPIEVHEWGCPLLPWWPVRVQSEELRSTRGKSLISDQAMRTADRYNANEQVSWLIARYNSHGNLAVIGDTALATQEGKPVHKDVADVLTFPGGTALKQITLPTDPQMIEHQRKVLLEALYGGFGLVRTDQETVSNLGEVSGYALELLNQRSEVTFNRVRAELIRDLKALLMRVVDCYTAWSGSDGPEDDQDEPEGNQVSAEEAGQVEADPYPTRQITIHLGTGYIVDKAMIREMYLAGLISQREALRMLGYKDERINKIQNEQAEERPVVLPAEKGTFGSSVSAGSTIGNAQRDADRNGTPVGGAL